MGRKAAILHIEKDLSISNHVCEFCQRALRNKGDVTVLSPFLKMNSFEAFREAGVPCHGSNKGRSIDAVPFAGFKHSKCLGEKPYLFLLTQMFEEIFVENVVTAVIWERPCHAGKWKDKDVAVLPPSIISLKVWVQPYVEV
jgi:hypothetical protein